MVAWFVSFSTFNPLQVQSLSLSSWYSFADKCKQRLFCLSMPINFNWRYLIENIQFVGYTCGTSLLRAAYWLLFPISIDFLYVCVYDWRLNEAILKTSYIKFSLEQILIKIIANDSFLHIVFCGDELEHTVEKKPKSIYHK